MSNDIRVPREEVERLVKLLAYQAHPHQSPHAAYWQGLLDAPAEQHQGEPVAEVVDMKYNRVQFYRRHGDDSKPYLEPGVKLYTHADPGELEQLLCKREVENRDLAKDNHTLRGKLASLESLTANLKNAHDFKASCALDPDGAQETGAMRDAYEWCRTAGDELYAALSVSAEPEVES